MSIAVPSIENALQRPCNHIFVPANDRLRTPRSPKLDTLDPLSRGKEFASQ